MGNLAKSLDPIGTLGLKNVFPQTKTNAPAGAAFGDAAVDYGAASALVEMISTAHLATTTYDDLKHTVFPRAPKVEAAYKAIVVTDTCGFCQGLKDYIREQGLSDKVKLINATTPEGRKFAVDHRIRGVPEC